MAALIWIKKLNQSALAENVKISITCFPFDQYEYSPIYFALGRALLWGMLGGRINNYAFRPSFFLFCKSNPVFFESLDAKNDH